ncbi:dystroglycan-related [Anaeramoeba flamelloides]|uniref:Dystroglycan-related n=1 Tax=Anaeramoeba flamelloides TaxID=1746091 RepID=A0ABQ8YUG9_9EUKA|nr:dystroglycan-related [Anaeramoeba flamelloides]
MKANLFGFISFVLIVLFFPLSCKSSEVEKVCTPEDLSGAVTFSGSENNNNHFQFSHQSNGDIVVVYTNSSETGNIYCRVFNSDLVPLGTEFEITTNKTLSPQVLSLDQTFFVVVWKEEGGAEAERYLLKGQVFESVSRTKIGSSFTLTEKLDGTNDYDFTLAALEGNKYIIAWEEILGGEAGSVINHTIYGTIRDRTGNVLKPKYEIVTENNFNETHPTIAKMNDFNDTFVVVWVRKYFLKDEEDDLPNEYDQIKGQIFDSEGNKIGEQFQVESNDLPITTSSLAVSSFVDSVATRFIVTWDEITTNQDTYPVRSSTQVFSQLFDGSGNKVGSVVGLIRDVEMVNNEQVQLSIETLPNDDFILTFAKIKSAYSSRIYYQVYNHSGSALTETTTLTSSFLRIEKDPKIECLFKGQEEDEEGYTCLVVYQSFDLMSYKQTIEGTKFNFNLKPYPTQNEQIAEKKLFVGEYFEFAFGENTFSDADNETLTYESELANGQPLPDWLNFNSTDRTFSGTPPNHECHDTLDIKLTAANRCDRSIATNFDFLFNVSNHDPIINTNQSKQIGEQILFASGENFEFAFGEDAFLDADNEKLTYGSELANGQPLPDWIDFNSTGRSFAGVAYAYNNCNTSLSIAVTATDECNNFVTDYFALNVLEAPPYPQCQVSKKCNHIPISSDESEPYVSFSDSLAQFEDKSFVYVWNHFSLTKYVTDIRLRFFDEQGDPVTNDLKLDITNTSNIFFPDVEVFDRHAVNGGDDDNDGDESDQFIVLWEHYDRSRDVNSVYGQIFEKSENTTITKFGSEFGIVQGDYTHSQAVATLDRDKFVVVWEKVIEDDGDTKQFNLYATIRDRYGNILKPNFEICMHEKGLETSMASVSKINHSNGSFVVMWERDHYIDEEMSTYQSAHIMGQIYDNEGNKINERFEFIADNHPIGRYSKIIRQFESQPQFIVAWVLETTNSEYQVTDNYYVEAQIFDQLGNKAGEKLELVLGLTSSSHINIVTMENGNFILTYTHNVEDGNQLSNIIFDHLGNVVIPEYVMTDTIQSDRNINGLILSNNLFFQSCHDCFHEEADGMIYAHLFDFNLKDFPMLNETIEDKTFSNGEYFEFAFGDDAFLDADNETLTYGSELANGQPLPDWIHFNSNNRSFNGTQPNDECAETLSIKLTATNRCDQKSSTFFDLTFLNQDPFLDKPIPNQNLTAGEYFEFQFANDTFSDPDNEIFVYRSELAKGEPLPDWIHFNSNNRIFNGTQPNDKCTETLSIKLTATNLCDQSVTTFFNLTFLNHGIYINKPIPNQYLNVGEEFEFQFASNTFIEAQNRSIAYTAEYNGINDNPPDSWISFQNVTRSFVGKFPINECNSSFEITIHAQDSCNNSVSQTMDVFVINEPLNLKHKLVDQFIKNTKDGFSIYNVKKDSFVDPEQANITYKASLNDDRELPEWIVFDINYDDIDDNDYGQLTFSFNASLIRNKDNQEFEIKVSANDSCNVHSDTFILTIEKESVKKKTEFPTTIMIAVVISITAFVIIIFLILMLLRRRVHPQTDNLMNRTAFEMKQKYKELSEESSDL